MRTRICSFVSVDKNLFQPFSETSVAAERILFLLRQPDFGTSSPMLRSSLDRAG